MIDLATHILLLFALLSGNLGLEVVIGEIAEAFEINPEIALRVVEYETAGTWDPNIPGDDGEAIGLWQWHLESWLMVRKHMGASLKDLRSDPIDSTITAMYAWKVMNLQHWWSTYTRASEEVRRKETQPVKRHECLEQ